MRSDFAAKFTLSLSGGVFVAVAATEQPPNPNVTVTIYLRELAKVHCPALFVHY